MRESIILAPGANGTELIRSMAKYGRNSLGMRIMSPTELAKYALMKSGVALTREFLPAAEEASVIYAFLKMIPYFNAASFADAEQLAIALRTLRGMVTKNEKDSIQAGLSDGEFPEKNEAIFQVYLKYIENLAAAGLIDGIGMIREALAGASAIDADFLILKEFPLTNLEKAFLHHLSGGAERETGLPELFQKPNKALQDVTFTEGYGAVNEVEHILAEIYEKKIPLDQCVVASAGGNEYNQLFYDLSRSYDVPMTFGGGIPITNANPARILKLLHLWSGAGYFGVDGLKELIFSDAFDRKKLSENLGILDGEKRKTMEALCEMAGALRLCFDETVNDSRLKPYSKMLAQKISEGREEYRIMQETARLTAGFARELQKGIAYIVETYAIIRTEQNAKMDQAALNVIRDMLHAYAKYDPEGDPTEIIPEILGKTVCSENSKAGHLHITGVSGALSAVRENLYLCGFSSANFPGSPQENYLLLDHDLERFGGARFTSAGRIAEKKKTLAYLLELAGALAIPVRLSYAGYDLATLKEQNPSSVLFSIYEGFHPGRSIEDFRSSLYRAEYFQENISSARFIGKAYCEGSAMSFISTFPEMIIPDDVTDRYWSPSALEIFFECPRRFYLTKILRIPEDEADDPFSVLNPAQLGTLAHAMMEILGSSKEVSKNEFLRLCDNAFEDFLLGRPPMHRSAADREKNEFLRMMAAAFDADPGNEILSAEEEYRMLHPSGIKLRGYPDRIERIGDGSCVVVDFKTKRSTEHKKDDIDTCLQVVIYAWMCEQAGIPVSSCEYRYLRKRLAVTCSFDDRRKAELQKKLETFKSALQTHDFPRNESKETCKYCKMADICCFPGEVREKKEDDDEAES